jgi:hypothetical protein
MDLGTKEAGSGIGKKCKTLRKGIVTHICGSMLSALNIEHCYAHIQDEELSRTRLVPFER